MSEDNWMLDIRKLQDDLLLRNFRKNISMLRLLITRNSILGNSVKVYILFGRNGRTARFFMDGRCILRFVIPSSTNWREFQRHYYRTGSEGAEYALGVLDFIEEFAIPSLLDN